ncbi:hypothetical protein ACFE04_011067 [Oxalis oulophora]
MATTVSAAFSSTINNSITTIRPSSYNQQHSCALPISTNVCYFKQFTLTNNIINNKNKTKQFMKPLRSVEEDTLIPEAEASNEPAVSVPVSPSDTLTMFFQADGTMNESDIPKVTKALEGTEGIADLNVRVLEGIASVELTKQTTVQATGVASSLVEAIQGAGFKLQTLNLSFEDEEDVLVA